VADTVLYAQPYGAMLLAPDVPCLIVAWYGFANSEQFRELMDHGLALYQAEAQHTQPLGWLADTSGLSAIRAADQQWLAAESAGLSGGYSAHLLRSARKRYWPDYGEHLFK
jgi:hypothetical protein